MTPQERIYNQRELIKLVLEHEYLPQTSNAHFGQVVEALKELGHKVEMGCSGCVTDVMRIAKIYLIEYEATIVKAVVVDNNVTGRKPKHHKFPKHKK